ncbi:MAG: methyltransferase domain-containing protein [Proteobacteria bacterium]|nr:methyltransferase domain-containing protein [Pseudomonadota bacterium]
MSAKANTQLQHLLAGARQHLQKGHADLALPLLKQARGIAPQSDDVLTALGGTYMSLNDFENAEEVLQKAIAINPTSAAHQSLGAIAIIQKKYKVAVEHFSKLAAANERDYEAWQNLGHAFFLDGRIIHALLVFLKIAKEVPDSLAFKSRVTSILKEFVPPKYEQVYRDAVMLCLGDERLTQDDVNLPYTQILKLSPHHPLITAGIKSSSYDSYKKIIETVSLTELGDDFLLGGLTAFIIRDDLIERSLIQLRRYLLEMYLESPKKLQSHIPFLIAQAMQAHLNEYVYEEDASETAAIQALEANLANTSGWSPENTVRFLLLAAYRPVIDTPAVSGFITDAEILAVKNPALSHLLLETVTDIREERALKKEIPSLGASTDEVSQLVRAMYEQNPYPRWRTALSLEGTTNPALNLAALKEKADGKPLEMLIAGCGTGMHIVQTSANFKGANITAIDLSFSSLAYAKRKCTERGLTNVTFLQADILDLGKLEKKFDVVECVGVLHHMKDPMAGWRVLESLLKPGGYMRIGLYSELARKSVVDTRAFIAENSYPSTLEGIRACRKAIKALPNDHPIRSILTTNDFYSTSLCRDLVFHVQEHRFTIPQIRACLAELHLEFKAFNIASPATAFDYWERNPTDRLFSNLDLWEAYERRFPSTFWGMYQFWCQKPVGAG